MKKLFWFFALAAFVGWTVPAAHAHVACAVVCEQVTVTECSMDGNAMEREVADVIRCNESSEDTDPTDGICGQTCVEGTFLIGGWAGMDVPAGCIRAVEAGTDTLLGDDCVQSAVSACEDHGCATREHHAHPCGHMGLPTRGQMQYKDYTNGETAGACEMTEESPYPQMSM